MHSCPICRELGHVGTSCPTATMARHPLSLPKWVTLEGFESEPQSYDGGNVTVEDPPYFFLTIYLSRLYTFLPFLLQ